MSRFMYSTNVELPHYLHAELTLEVEYNLEPAEPPFAPAQIEIVSKRVINYSFYRIDDLDVVDVEQHVADKYIIMYDPLSHVDEEDILDAIKEHLL